MDDFETFLDRLGLLKLGNLTYEKLLGIEGQAPSVATETRTARRSQPSSCWDPKINRPCDGLETKQRP